MRRPDFFIVGAPRCGTTAMDNYLGQHPEILMAPVKESHFFAPDFQAPASGFKREADYLPLFAAARDEKMVGESSVGYLFSQVAAARIKEFNPRAKIIIMLRNPIDMLHSYHCWLRAEGVEGVRDFVAELPAANGRKPEGPSPADPSVPIPLLIYRQLGEFSPHVQRFFDVFGRQNVHVILFDELKADAAQVYRETCAFLGVNMDFQPQFRVINANRQARSEALSRYLRSLRKPQHNHLYHIKHLVPQAWRRALVQRLRNFNMKEQVRSDTSYGVRERLSAQFAPDLDRLSDMLGRDLSYWSRA